MNENPTFVSPFFVVFPSNGIPKATNQLMRKKFPSCNNSSEFMESFVAAGSQSIISEVPKYYHFMYCPCRYGKKKDQFLGSLLHFSTPKLLRVAPKRRYLYFFDSLICISDTESNKVVARS